MRRTRRLFLLTIAIILAVVGASYYVQRSLMIRAAPKAPRALPHNVQAASPDWCYREDEGGVPKVEICARDMERTDRPSTQIKLRGVDLKLFHKGGKIFDRVKSASAEYDEASGVLFSDGDVEITLAVPADGPPKGRLLTIRSSGVRVDRTTGKASTDRPASFAFDLGEGRARGAAYDPATRELQLHNDAVLDWRGHGAKTPMKVEAGQVTYKESESKVYLAPWSRFTRDQLKLEAADSVVTLEDGAIRLVEARQAKGTDEYPARKLAFGADELRMVMSPKSEVEKIAGTGNAKLDAVASSGRTLVNSDRVDLAFAIVNGESVLQSAVANGRSTVDSRPAGQRGARVLKSEVIEMKMRPGGEEIDSVQTHSPADLDLQPATAAEPRRHMTSDRLWLAYGAKNQLQTARGTQVTTRTERPKRKPAITTSKDLLAEFDEKSGAMKRLEQWNDFRYEEGDQHATASKALLESGRITLDGHARMWDPTGSVEAGRIVMTQDTGDFIAEQQVRSSRLPDRKAAGTGAMLSEGESVQATADRMSSMNDNQRVLYEGKAVLWQTGNRLQADRVLIDRGNKKLQADGNVVSQFLDTGKKKTGFTTIRAASLEYRDADRLAWYRGGVRLLRDGMDVKSTELRAWMKEPPKEPTKDEGSRLDRAFADGAVEIAQASPGRTRRGSAEHGEYYVAEEKVVLYGGHPQVVDSVKGTTRGRKLTYWTNSDSFQGDGTETQPSVSTIKRK